MKEKIKVIVWGCSGYMGSVVRNLLQDSETLEYLCGIDIDSTNSWECGADVVIDFSSPEGTMQMLKFATEFKVPVVIATTGFTPEHEKEINKASKVIPVFKSANMSFEVALLKNTLKKLANQLRDSDIEIVEVHHNRKKDAPSGTAKLLADSINSGLDEPRKIVYGREGKRQKDEIGIASLRGGNIVGEHSVNFFNQFETLKITHIAHTRDVFAAGSLKAAEFIVKQQPGLYTMDDLF